ncbi:hypothetical protein EKG39_22380 [Shewanella atlantica]|uniref:BIG2 domain-containing protein n=1 Tax=Shewanella atlantica TaxID=271099 RepID=A0A3S0I646_9GAMM|nr:hypothetical protein EKG39_22380 [Shewanella atlantica]
MPDSHFGCAGYHCYRVCRHTEYGLHSCGVRASIAKGTAQVYVATATYSDSTTQDVTNQVNWTSMLTDTATIDLNGQATSVNAGDTVIQAHFEGVDSNVADLTVVETSVVMWGESINGGNSSAVQAPLTNVQTIDSTGSAFAAVKADGTVVKWGNSDYGADSSVVQSQLISVQTICSTIGAFAALKTESSATN